MQAIRSWTVVVGLCLLAASGCSQTQAQTQHQMPPAEVAVARVVSKQIENFSDFSGRLEAKR